MFRRLKPTRFCCHHSSNIASSKEKPSVYVEDLEVCKSHDRFKSFYEHCQNMYKASQTNTNFNHVLKYGIALLKEYLNNDAEGSLILDVGCELGTTGPNLQEAGFTELHGVVTNPNELSPINEQKIYSKISVFDSKDCQILPFGENIYDGIICTGMIFSSYLTIGNAIPDFCRVLRVGGFAMFIFYDEELDPRSLMSALGEGMFSKTLELCSMESYNFEGNDSIEKHCYCCLIRVIQNK